MLGSLGFVAASLACAFASSPGMLIGFRLAQGAAAALLIPQGLGISGTVLADRPQQGVYGVRAGHRSVGGARPDPGRRADGPTRSGRGWRLIFFVNLPLGLIAAIGAARLMPDPARPAADLDLAGTLLTALGMGLLIYPLIQGREAGWPAWTYLMIAASALSFALPGLRVARSAAGTRPADRGQHLQAPLLQRRAGHDHRVLRRDDRDPAGADAVPAARRALLGDPRRSDAGSVCVGTRSAPRWRAPCWSRGSGGPCCRWPA